MGCRCMKGKETFLVTFGDGTRRLESTEAGANMAIIRGGSWDRLVGEAADQARETYK
jgi:hypothetical protein